MPDLPIPDRTKPLPVREFGPMTIIPEVIEEFPGNTRLHIIDAGDLPICRISTVWGHGENCIPPSMTNVSPEDAHLHVVTSRVAATTLPQLMLEGTKNHSSDDIATKTDSAGAWLQAATRLRHSMLTTLAMNEQTPAMLSLVREVLTSATLPEDAFKALQRRNVLHRRTELSRVLTVATDQASQLAHGKSHPYIFPITPEEIEQVSLDAIRNTYTQAIGQTPIDIYVGGRMDEKMLEAVRTHASELSSLQKGNITQYPCIPYSPEPPQWVRLEQPGSLQSAVAAILPVEITRDSPDYIDLRSAVVALGGYFGSRLMTNIREKKGLTYGISAQLIGIPEGSVVQILAQCNRDKTDTVVEEIRNEIRELATTPMPEDELRRLRGFLTSGLAATLDTPFSIMQYHLTRLLVGTPEGYFESQSRSLLEMTAERIRDISARYLDPESLRLVTVG